MKYPAKVMSIGKALAMTTAMVPASAQTTPPPASTQTQQPPTQQQTQPQQQQNNKMIVLHYSVVNECWQTGLARSYQLVSGFAATEFMNPLGRSAGCSQHLLSVPASTIQCTGISA
jgi:hypothetical protein